MHFCIFFTKKKIKKREKKLRLAKSLLAAKIPYISQFGKEGELWAVP